MAFPTLTIPATAGVDVGTAIETKPRILRAPFGDGYSQRAGDGLNTMGKKIEVSFSALTTAETQTIVSFFADKKGYQPFMWTIPGEASARQWIATKWRVTPVANDIQNVAASFEETFDP